MALRLRRGDQGGALLAILAFAVVASLVLAGLAGRVSEARADWRAALTRPERPLSERLALIDEALGCEDLGGAIHDWHDAFGVAFRSRRWEAMADVGDAALRIDARTVRPGDHLTGFRAEARRAYLSALLRARAEHSPEGIRRVAGVFAKMGDSDAAARTRAMLAER